jgi:hypothetical protein
MPSSAREYKSAMGKAAKEEDKALSEDEKRVKKELKGRIHFGKDTYGAMHFSVLRALHGDEIKHNHWEDDELPLNQNLALCHTCCVHLFAVLLQLFAVFVIMIFANGDSLDKYEMLHWKLLTSDPIFAAEAAKDPNYNLKNATVLINQATAAGTPFNASIPFYKDILAVCDKDANVPYAKQVFVTLLGLEFFHSIIGALFSLVMYCWKVPTADDVDDLAFVIADPKDFFFKKKQVITYASIPAKLLIGLLILLPQFALDIFTFFVGAGFVSLATNVRVVVTKSLGISLIGKLPTIVAALVLQEDTFKYVKKTSIAYDKPKFCDPKSVTCPNLGHFLGYPLLKAGCAILFSFIFVNWVYGDIEELQYACYEYGQKFIAEQCQWPCGFLGFYNGPASYKAGGVKMPKNTTLFGQAPPITR